MKKDLLKQGWTLVLTLILIILTPEEYRNWVRDIMFTKLAELPAIYLLLILMLYNWLTNDSNKKRD